MAAEPPAKKNKPNKLSNKKEEKRRCKESKLIQQLEKQKRKEENKQQVQQEEKESKGELRALVCLYTTMQYVSVEGEFRGVGKKGQACVQLARILQYLECPQYLRKSFFPKHKDLQFAGLLNPLDSPHHMRIDEEAEFRQGVVLDQPSKPGKGSFVNCGMRKVCVVVAPHIPRTEAGLYWGYSVRLASCLSAVFTECPYKDGYDLTVGTSERGNSADHITLPPFKHMLVVFGGLQGLEASVDADENLNVADPGVLFDLYLNTCPGQGSRTIRTEQAILISLSGLRQKISAVFPDQPKG
uniref:SPOUT domain containing methyltransferase 1 n=1 Tax=Cyprinus carpio TaxID=7962 RepID=A0A8C2HQV2_CYPCA